MELDRETKTGLDISSEAEVLNYVADVSREVIARVQFGSLAEPIVGNGQYVLRMYVDDVLFVPDNPILVPSGTTRAIGNSRPVVLDAGEELSVRMVGLGGDTAVTTEAILRDATPAAVSDFSGTGTRTVNHDYGGADNLAYKDGGGVGIDNATVLVYLKSDYDAGNTGDAYVKARAATDVNGRWTRSVLLDPATYTLVYSKQGYYGPDAREVTVT